MSLVKDERSSRKQSDLMMPYCMSCGLSAIVTTQLLMRSFEES